MVSDAGCQDTQTAASGGGSTDVRTKALTDRIGFLGHMWTGF